MFRALSRKADELRGCFPEHPRVPAALREISSGLHYQHEEYDGVEREAFEHAAAWLVLYLEEQ